MLHNIYRYICMPMQSPPKPSPLALCFCLYNLPYQWSKSKKNINWQEIFHTINIPLLLHLILLPYFLHSYHYCLTAEYQQFGVPSSSREHKLQHLHMSWMPSQTRPITRKLIVTICTCAQVSLIDKLVYHPCKLKANNISINHMKVSNMKLQWLQRTWAISCMVYFCDHYTLAFTNTNMVLCISFICFILHWPPQMLI